jgi:hypothetical protein
LTAHDELKFITEQQIRPYCGALFFSPSRVEALKVVDTNGSYGLIDTGQKKILVTAHHVWSEFKIKRNVEPNLQLLLCLEQNFPPAVLDTRNLIDEDQKLDLAIFNSGSPCFLIRAGRVPHLIGFTIEGGLQLLRFTHVRCINVDGSIRRESNSGWTNWTESIHTLRSGGLNLKP